MFPISDEPIKNSTRVRQLESDLQVEAVHRDTDVGDYVCIVTSTISGARQASPPARLNIICKYTFAHIS